MGSLQCFCGGAGLPCWLVLQEGIIGGESGGNDPALPAGACEHRQPLSSFQLSARRVPAVNTALHWGKTCPRVLSGGHQEVQKGLY